jgi:pyridoxamine 5'-phosphate oxidase
MQYTRNPPLHADQLSPDPLQQLESWIEAARDAGMIEPTAMTLATADTGGQPSARVVLLKALSAEGLTFYTCYEGRKGRDLAGNPRVAATFWWDRLERQVRVEGRAELLPRADNQRYFASRPRESQLGAITSRQSRVVATRAELDDRLRAVTGHWEGRTPECPDHWGGYLIRPQCVEFWQGRLGRLHDRLRYRRVGDGWVIERLEP